MTNSSDTLDGIGSASKQLEPHPVLVRIQEPIPPGADTDRYVAIFRLILESGGVQKVSVEVGKTAFQVEKLVWDNEIAPEMDVVGGSKAPTMDDGPPVEEKAELDLYAAVRSGTIPTMELDLGKADKPHPVLSKIVSEFRKDELELSFLLAGDQDSFLQWARLQSDEVHPLLEDVVLEFNSNIPEDVFLAFASTERDRNKLNIEDAVRVSFTPPALAFFEDLEKELENAHDDGTHQVDDRAGVGAEEGGVGAGETRDHPAQPGPPPFMLPPGG